MKNAAIPIESLLSYEPLTGVLRWIVSPNRRIPIGSIAGTNAANGRRAVIVNRKRYHCARIAWLLSTGAWPAGHIDHINGDPTDDRLSNLRDVCAKTNCENKRKPTAGNKLGVLGVHAVYGRYKADISVNGKTMHLGSFNTAHEAHAAYVQAKRKFHKGCTL